MTSITKKQLAEWKRLADEATSGPWTYSPNGHGVHAHHHSNHPDDGRFNICQARFTNPDSTANERFIAAARTAVPALIAEVERLRTELQRAEEALTDFYRLEVIEQIVRPKYD